MKNILIFAGVAGVVLAGAIYFMQSKNIDKSRVPNVEDGFSVEA